MGNMKKISNKTKGTEKKIAEICLRWRLKKDLLRNWFANWNISNKAREVSLKSTPAFFWPWPCLAPADRATTPYPSPSVPIAHTRMNHRVAVRLKASNPGRGKNSAGKIQPDAVELSKRSCTRGWYFMSLQLQLQRSQVYTELGGPSA